jgi:glutamine cyclotransferase
VTTGAQDPHRARHLAVVVAVLAAIAAAGSPQRQPALRPAALPRNSYRVINVYPHDPQAYTQGLVFVDGFLYESTGLNGRSSIRKVKLETGAVVDQRPVDARYFAEGLAEWRGKLVQLTWQSHLAFVYDRATLRQERTFSYNSDGWGLTSDGSSFILSDGSADGTLRFHDPSTFRLIKRVTVRDRGMPVAALNELEFVKGEVWANVWHTDRIARIRPATGEVVAWIDLDRLLLPGQVTDHEAVLNGIAYDAARDRIFVTGKLWPKLFEIQLQP